MEKYRFNIEGYKILIIDGEMDNENDEKFSIKINGIWLKIKFKNGEEVLETYDTLSGACYGVLCYLHKINN